jgi:hypothetical protein
MEKLFDAAAARAAHVFLFLLILFGLSGCAGVESVVPPDHRILFGERETGQGSFLQGQLTVEYNYRLTGSNIMVDGQVSYLGGVDLLDVRLLFIDAGGKVIKRQIVYFSGFRTNRAWMTERSFQETLVVPPGSAGISFSYTAEPRRNYR